MAAANFGTPPPPPGSSSAGSAAPEEVVSKGDKQDGSGRGGKRRKKIIYKERAVHHDDGEGNWLVSYADMMTLLFGFFVIMSAFSTPDSGKMEKLKEETAKSMGVEYKNPYAELSNSLQEILDTSKLTNDVQITKAEDGITIVSKGTVFFDSGSVDLKPSAEQLMRNISGILVERAKGLKVVVEGHTDDVPIVSARFPSNWELSAARASTVIRLLESVGFEHENLRPMGLADTEPIVPVRGLAGAELTEMRAKNRRIVIRIKRELPKRLEQTQEPEESSKTDGA